MLTGWEEERKPALARPCEMELPEQLRDFVSLQTTAVARLGRLAEPTGLPGLAARVVEIVDTQVLQSSAQHHGVVPHLSAAVAGAGPQLVMICGTGGNTGVTHTETVNNRRWRGGVLILSTQEMGARRPTCLSPGEFSHLATVAASVRVRVAGRMIRVW